MIQFRLETNNNKHKVDFLRRQFVKGPVVKAEGSTEPKLSADGKPQVPYSIWANEELARLRQEILADMKERDEEYSNWVGSIQHILRGREQLTIVSSTSRNMPP